MNPESAIRNAIDDHGPITFAEFMEIALYGSGGYYTSGSPISASGDYFTSPSAHPLFGALIAVQLQEMWRSLGSPGEFTVVEEGAGSGVLAADITEYADSLTDGFKTSLRYVAVDIAPPAVTHYPVLPMTGKPAGITGCVLSNELLDAMPVHRFEVREAKLHEIYVAWDGDNLIESLGPLSSPEIERRLAPFMELLPDGYRGEVNPGIEAWAKRQSETLDRGWILSIDYGFERADLYRSGRAAGSLRTYYQHTLGQDPLRHAGKQDITAHVDFTAIDEALTAVGFDKLGRTDQVGFLKRLGVESALEQLNESALPRPVKHANQTGIQALIDPEGLGKFIVAAHSHNVEHESLIGFTCGAAGPGRLANPPLLNSVWHINLTGSQQSPGYFEVQSLEELFSDEQ